jgi:hypothetical protein
MLNLFPAQDFWILFWLRWRQFRDGAVYWLRVLGYQPNEKSIMQNIYVLYLLGIGSIWLFAMWAWGYDLATNIGTMMAPQTLADLLTLLPNVVLVVQVVAMVVALRSTPLKLSFADMAYVAGSPLARSVPVLLGFIRQVAVRIILFGAMWALLAVVLLGAQADALASLRAVAMIALLVIFTWATAWLLGILRLVYPSVSRWPLWLGPLLLFGLLYYVFPDAVLWPGRSVILVIYGLAPVWLVPLMLVMAAAQVVVFVWLGNRINMIQAVDESVAYARLAALGLMAWRMPDLQLRVRLQTSQRGHKPRWHLPRAYGRSALFTRSIVSYVRHPIMLLINVIWGALMTYVAVLILVNQLPPQLWIGWLLIAGVAPPVGLLHTYRMDVQETFLRQFLPFNGLQILLADIALPLLALIAGSMVVWWLQPLSPDILLLGLTFIPLLGFMLALCGAVSLNRGRALQARLLATGLSFGLAALAGFGLGTPLAAFVVSILAIMTMGGMLVQDM